MGQLATAFPVSNAARGCYNNVYTNTTKYVNASVALINNMACSSQFTGMSEDCVRGFNNECKNNYNTALANITREQYCL